MFYRISRLTKICTSFASSTSTGENDKSLLLIPHPIKFTGILQRLASNWSVRVGGLHDRSLPLWTLTPCDYLNPSGLETLSSYTTTTPSPQSEPYRTHLPCSIYIHTHSTLPSFFDPDLTFNPCPLPDDLPCQRSTTNMGSWKGSGHGCYPGPPPAYHQRLSPTVSHVRNSTTRSVCQL